MNLLENEWRNAFGHQTKVYTEDEIKNIKRLLNAYSPGSGSKDEPPIFDRSEVDQFIQKLIIEGRLKVK